MIRKPESIVELWITLHVGEKKEKLHEQQQNTFAIDCESIEQGEQYAFFEDAKTNQSQNYRSEKKLESALAPDNPNIPNNCLVENTDKQTINKANKKRKPQTKINFKV